MSLPVVLIADKLSGSTVAALGDAVEVRWVDGPDREKLLAALPEADALLVRSATTVDAGGHCHRRPEAEDRRARAGVGLITSMSTLPPPPESWWSSPRRRTSTALPSAIALMLSAARQIPPPTPRCATVWRSARRSPEIFGKTVGVVGLGRIGQLVAQRLAAFGTHVIAYDPHVPRRAPDNSASSCFRLTTRLREPTSSRFICRRRRKRPD